LAGVTDEEYSDSNNEPRGVPRIAGTDFAHGFYRLRSGSDRGLRFVLSMHAEGTPMNIVSLTIAAAGMLAATMTLSAAAADAVAPEDPFDIAVQGSIGTDQFNYGYTLTDHQPHGLISITPSYGILYGNLTFDNQRYTLVSDDVRSQLKLVAGITPSSGDLSFDINVARRWLFDFDPYNRTVPYITGTYKFSDKLSASLGGGYYFYDRPDVSYQNTWELFGSVDWAPIDLISLHGETAYDDRFYPNSEKPYWELIGAATLHLPRDVSLTGKVGFEDYFAEQGNGEFAPSYFWYDVGLDYAFNDHISGGIHYQANDLGSDVSPGSDCYFQGYSDCDGRVFATLTFNGKLSDARKK
jgi:opacity protein-like surface antigen